MTSDSPVPAPSPIAARMLFVVGAAALLAGLYGRFKGIGTWPLGVDEFYISRSIDNVLRSGLPAFPCGGYYNRGLTFQYLVAALRLLGWSPEFAGRFVAGICSLAVLPAAYLLTRRISGRPAACTVVIILCVSIWEIEMARFARMYAPFQAVSAWYFVAFLSYTVDRRTAALGWMAGLSVLGVLTWEGGVLLGVASLFAVLLARLPQRLTWADARLLTALGALLVLLYLATHDLRGFADMPGQTEAPPQASAALQFATAWVAPLRQHPAWSWGLAIPLAFLVAAGRWLSSYRDRYPLVIGLCVVTLAALAHAFMLAAGALLLMLLVRLLDRRALGWHEARYFWLFLASSLAFWVAVSAVPVVMHRAPAASLGSALIGFPDVYDRVLRPWGRTLPVLSLELCAALGYLCWISIGADRDCRHAGTALLSLVILLILVVGAIPTDRIETRYTFFLYPCLIVLAVGAAYLALTRLTQLRTVPWLLAGVPLLCFGATEDFQPGHVAHIDAGDVNFRMGMSAALKDHYYPRNDIRGAAQWFAATVRPGDVVVTGIPSLDEYYPHIDYVYLDQTDDRYEAYVCDDGRTERWTNRPVAYTAPSLRSAVESGRRVYANLYAAPELALRQYAATVGWSVTQVWKSPYGGSSVLLVERRPTSVPVH